MISRTAAALVPALLAACAAPPPPSHVSADRVVLLPGSDGTTGAVVIRRGEQESVLDNAYATGAVGPDGKLQTGYSDPAAVRQQFADALKALPAAIASFTVYFIFGQDELTDESRSLVDSVLQDFARRPAADITVTGHADQTGTDAINDPLSLRRAERIRDMLVKLGVPIERIVTAARGSREPLVRGGDAAAGALNRRVEISVR